MKKFTKQVFKHKSGFRFRRTFIYMRRKYGAHWLMRLIFMTVGILVLLVGIAMIVGPGPGWVVIVIGLIIIACVSYPLARHLDKTERSLMKRYQQLRNRRKKNKTK